MVYQAYPKPTDYDNSCDLGEGAKPKRSTLYEDDKPAQVQGFTTIARRVRGDEPGTFVPAEDADRRDSERDNMSDMPAGPSWLW